MKRLFKYFLMLALIAALAGGGYWGYRQYFADTSVVRFNTVPVTRSDIASTISATGTVEPEELVNVGAQVGGMVTTFGQDVNGRSVDYGSPVKAGMVLARIDDVVYDAEMRQAKAQKLQAEATILTAKANIEQARAKFQLAESNWVRACELQPKGAIAKSEYDNCQSAYYTAKADIAVSEAALAQANAQLAIAVATLDKAERNLGYCVITSPVDGVIIDRRVSIGQTVNASMNAPSLFLIAKDLRKMQVWVSVNEADVGAITPGMPVIFTVDAFPDNTFKGEVHKIRLNATMSQNVVTYVVEVSTDNSDGKLLPYLTASVKFIRDSRSNVLTVPNAALRFTPEAAQIPPQYQASLADSGRRSGAERRVWVLEEDALRPVMITVGLNDGVTSEVAGGELRENMRIVTASTLEKAGTAGASASGDGRSPFLPKPPQRKR